MSIRSYKGVSPRLHTGAWVDDTAVVIGDVELGEDVSVWPMCVLRGDVQRITIGARTNIQDGSVLHVSSDSEFLPGGAPLTIGSDVTIGHKCVIHACTIGDGVLIGIGAIVLDKAVIESGAMLGAGALVPPGKVIEGGHLWVGQPARKARPLTEKEAQFLKYSAPHYVRTKNSHAAG